MFDIYIKDFNRNGQLVTTETKVQSIPATEEGELKLISPIVKNDMGNAEAFDFSIEGGTKFCEAFLQMKTFMRVVYDGTTIFMGRVLTVDNGFHGTRKVRCEGPLAFFNDSPVPGTKETARHNQSVNAYLGDLINNHNEWVKDSKRSFTLGQVPGQYSCSADQQLPNTSRKYGQDSWTDTKAALEDLRSHYGGYFRVRCGSIGSAITLDWMNHYFNSSVISQTVEVGKNIIDISSINEIDNIFTAIIPIGQAPSYKKDDGSTISSGNLYLDQKYVTVPEICSHFSASDLNQGYHSYSDYASAIDRYGYIYKTVSFEDAETKSDLYNKACEWILNNYQGEVPKFTVKAVDMRQIGENTQKISVGDRVKIVYPVIHEDGSVTKRETYQTCISISYDLYNPENNSYTFGIPANIMTKSYGLKKQSKSVDQTTSEPKNTESYTSSGGSKKSWINEVTGWLTSHKIHYNGEKPFKESYGRVNQHGPEEHDTPRTVSSEKAEMFLATDAILSMGDQMLWKAEKVGGTDSTFSQKTYNDLTVADTTGYAAKMYKDNHSTTEYWKLTRTAVSAISATLINQFNLCEYIKYEYGIDLKNGSVLGVVAPDSVPVEDEDGNEIGEVKEVLVEDPETGEKVVITQQFISKNGNAIVFSELGLPFEVKSIKDADGNIHFYKTDESGNWVEDNNYRQLVLKQKADEEFIGTVVESKLFDAAGNPVAYQFGQMLEKDEYKGQIVVAYVEGDQVNLGNKDTKWLYGLASRVNQQWVKPVNVTEVNGQKVLTYLDPAGTASYRGRYDGDGNFIVDPTGPIAFTGSGIWDEKNLALKGGIVTGKVGDEYVSFVKSDRLVIGDAMGDEKVLDALVTAGVVTEDESGKYHGQKLVADAVYTKDLKAINADIKTLQTDKLTTKDLYSKIAGLDYVFAKGLQVGTVSDGGTAAFYGTVEVTNNRNILLQPGSRILQYVSSDHGHSTSRYLDHACFGVTKTTSGNTVTLQFNDLFGNPIAESSDAYNGKVSFDIATSLLGSWSGSTLTVQDQAPVPHKYTVGFTGDPNVYLFLESDWTSANASAVTNYPKKVSVPVKVMQGWYGDDGDITDSTERYSDRINVDATPAYNNGWSAARSKVSWPGSNTGNNRANVYVPYSTVGQQTFKTFTIFNNGDNAVDLRYTDDNGNSVTCAYLTHNKYSAGYSAGHSAGYSSGYSNGHSSGVADGHDGVSGSDISIGSSSSASGSPSKKLNDGVKGKLWLKKTDGSWSALRDYSLSLSVSNAYHKKTVYDGDISVKITLGSGYTTITSKPLEDYPWNQL